MMLYPTIQELTEGKINRYELVIATAKGARKVIEKDIARDEYLKNLGLTVLRYSNLDINKNFKGVCEYIDLCVKQSLSQN